MHFALKERAGNTGGTSETKWASVPQVSNQQRNTTDLCSCPPTGSLKSTLVGIKTLSWLPQLEIQIVGLKELPGFSETSKVSRGWGRVGSLSKYK